MVQYIWPGSNLHLSGDFFTFISKSMYVEFSLCLRAKCVSLISKGGEAHLSVAPTI